MMEGPDYEWDDRKAEANIARGRPPFEDVRYFEFAAALIRDDSRTDYGERRLTAIGFVKGRLHVLIYTERNRRLRVISFRKANEREIELHDHHAKIVDR